MLEPTLLTWVLVIFGIALLFPLLVYVQLLVVMAPNRRKTQDFWLGKGSKWRDKTQLEYAMGQGGRIWCSGCRLDRPAASASCWPSHGATGCGWLQGLSPCISISSSGSRIVNTFCPREEPSHTIPTSGGSGWYGVSLAWSIP